METRGVRVRFSSPAHENRYWWAIIECDGRFLVCARERLVLPDGWWSTRWPTGGTGYADTSPTAFGRHGGVPSGRCGMAAGTGENAWVNRRQATACGRIQTGERQVTRFDQTGVTLTKHQNNAALGVNILPDAIGQRNQHELHWRFS